MNSEKMTALIGVKEHIVYCFIGHFPHEKEIEQPILIDIEVEAEVGLAAVTDQLEYTVNYVDIAQASTDIAKQKHYHLLETYIKDLLDYLFDHWPILWAKICVKKPRALATANYGFVEVQRRR